MPDETAEPGTTAPFRYAVEAVVPDAGA